MCIFIQKSCYFFIFLCIFFIIENIY